MWKKGNPKLKRYIGFLRGRVLQGGEFSGWGLVGSQFSSLGKAQRLGGFCAQGVVIFCALGLVDFWALGLIGF